MSRRRKPRPALPPACFECRPYGGTHRRAANGGMERCTCARGEKLSEGFGRKRKKRQPRKKPAFDGRMAATGE